MEKTMLLNDNLDLKLILNKLINKNFVIVDDFLKDHLCSYLCKRMQREKNFDDYYEDYQAIDYTTEDSITKSLSEEIISKCDLQFFERAWSFIYNTTAKGVKLHTDPDADVTMSIWVTPNNSIIDLDKNGFKLSNIPYPKDHNKPIDKEVKDFIKKEKVTFINIPYKYNRAIFFKSKLLHETNAVKTLEGIYNRRVSYTMLFTDNRI